MYLLLILDKYEILIYQIKNLSTFILIRLIAEDLNVFTINLIQ